MLALCRNKKYLASEPVGTINSTREHLVNHRMAVRVPHTDNVSGNNSVVKLRNNLASYVYRILNLLQVSICEYLLHTQSASMLNGLPDFLHALILDLYIRRP